MIVATAGHIDHGKTALVKALTGVDADRLAEEKRRGMTIDLGFAYRRLGEEAVIGFVDVPGHERLVRTMVAGASGVDFALLVVAADDGVMPQTLEHLAVIELIGIRRGAVAITKIDRVAADRVVAVEAEIRACLAPTALAHVPMFPVAPPTGEGIPALSAHLDEAARAPRERESGGQFRLAIDRAFTLAGVGLVVTGTVHAGSVAIGDHLVLSPAGKSVRVRGLHAQNRKAETAGAGERAALNIAAAGLEKNAIRRGDWLVAPQLHAPTARIDARVRLLGDRERPLAHWTPVHVHLGAEDVTARVAVLGAASIVPGGDGLVRLVLDRPIGALAGDRLVLRDQSARHTIAGGQVIDPFPPARGRAKPERLDLLAALDTSDHGAALAGLLDRSPLGVDLSRFGLMRNLTEEDAEQVFVQADMVRFGDSAMGHDLFAGFGGRIITALAAFHERHPDRAGPEVGALARLLPGKPASQLVAASLHNLHGTGRIAVAGGRIHLVDHRPALGPEQARDWPPVEAILGAAGLVPPVVHDIAKECGQPPDRIFRLLRRAEAVGLVVRIAENRFALPARLATLAVAAERLAGENRLTPAVFRDETGIGRNLAIELLEHFDRVGLTRRDGDIRRLVRPAAEIFIDRL